MHLLISADRNLSPFETHHFPLPKSKRECARIAAEFCGVKGPRGNRIRLSATRRIWRGVKMHRPGGFVFEPNWGFHVTIVEDQHF